MNSRRLSALLWGNVGNYVVGLAPFVVVWIILVGWLASLLYSRASWSEESDEAIVREWLDETRPFRKTLLELIREYLHLQTEARAGRVLPADVVTKRAEIDEQLRALTEPTRAYENKLPGFPILFRLGVVIPGEAGETEQIVWTNPLPRPLSGSNSRVRTLRYSPASLHGQPVFVECEYQLHAFNKLQRREQDRRRESLVAGAVLIAAMLLAVVFVVRFVRHELARETQQLKVLAAAEHQERELLETRLRQQQTERENEVLDRRAEQAEKAALELKSQIYASIGIMAGSYAHNIKNLLVRPNDLLRRCLDAEGLTAPQTGMLNEVQSTLGTVTDRLQEILRTVRRDPNESSLARIDLVTFVATLAQTWLEVGRDKWKLQIETELPAAPVWIEADYSHLQQALENLVFNARDATFEMRNHLREEARRTGPAERKQKLLEAASWKGKLTLRLTAQPETVLLEVTDNGIGMTEEVRANCLETHFSTKRDNALYEGHSAGMGLGLSFVNMVLEHHAAEFTIESAPFRGTTFRIRFRSPV